jgi:dTDP-4-amino-4,6-dideoxygalactose transaminase
MEKNINWLAKKKTNFGKVRKLLNKSYETNQMTNNGQCVRHLETLVRQYFEVDDNKAVIVVNNGTVAIQILAAAIKYENKNIKWATQSFTFPPSKQGNLIDAEIVDIDEEGGIDINKLGRNINGIIVTNIFGNVVNIEKYEKWAQNGNVLIFDNAATSLTHYRGKNCVNYGTGSSISFHHTKPFGFGEGGAIIVDKEYEKTVRCLINFGIELKDDAYYVEEGTNGKMSEISAAFIIDYLNENMLRITKKCRYLYEYMKKMCRKNNMEMFPSFHDDGKIVPASFTLLLNKSKDVIETLKKNNVFCRKYYTPLKQTDTTIKLYDRIVCVPCNADMTKKDIDRIVELIKLKEK